MGFQQCRFLLLLAFLYPLFFIILGNSLSTLQKQPLCHDHEKLALLQFKRSFLIDCDMAYDPSSSYPKVKTWESYEANRSEDCCLWDGVRCDEETGHVTGLDLSGSCLYGTFPANGTLFSLTHLEDLSLANNDFSFSQIPISIGHLYKLKGLNLSNSAFTGQIPSQVSELSRLTVLDLSFNGDQLGIDHFNLKLYDPSLHKFIRNLTSLNQLYLDGVDISSNLPVFLANLTSLKVISLQNCNLNGEVPASVFKLPNLEELVLSCNRELLGYLPEFQSSSPLKRIDLSVTGFSGELPHSIGNLGRLDTLRLWGCRFSGNIPPSLVNLTKLTNLVLSHNDFGGNIPSSIKNLTQLHVLGFSGLNIKHGTLVSWLPKLNKLTALALAHLSDLNLATDIKFLGNLTKLTYLDLSANGITGPVPNCLANLTQLVFLNLEGNQLQGLIPQWFSQHVYLRSLTLSYNFLFGGFETFLNLKNLQALYLSGVDLTFPSDVSTNSSLPKFNIIELDSCNVTEFPHFLRNQDKLQFLSLRRNSIKETIPQWFVNITREGLLSLDLSENLLTGFELPPVFLPWRNLKFLDLSGNRLQGLLPSPTSATLIYLVSDNQLTGTIPKQLCYASSLMVLDLSRNKMSGRIPNCIGYELGGSLLALNLRGNDFHGDIPQTLARVCTLKMINLSENRLKGELPKSLANCKMLEVLDIGRNRVNDTFPLWLRSLQKLQVLVLRHNNFHGQIESSESGPEDFPYLRVLDLSCNFYTGSLPFGYLRSWHMNRTLDEDQLDSSSVFTINSYFSVLNLIVSEDQIYNYSITIQNKATERYYSRILNVFQVVDFSSNNFTDQIPDFIGDLGGLQVLNLSNNNLHGQIPLSLAKVRPLESLDLSQNLLTGEIPQELTKLTSLEVFDVSHNHLKGPIPQGEQFNTFDNGSFDGNLALCGYPLSKKCGSINSSAPSPPQKMKTNDDTEAEVKDFMLIDWIVRLSGCVSGLIVGFVIGKIFITDRHHEWFMTRFARRRRRSNTGARRALRHR